MLQYNRGEWGDFDGLPSGCDDEELDDWLERLGFNPVKVEFGTDRVGGLDVFNNLADETYLVDVCWNGYSGRLIFLPDYPSLLMFLRDFGPVFQLSALRHDIKEMKQMMERTFRKEHGHDSGSVCLDCDPLEYERRIGRHKNFKATIDGIKKGR